MFAWSIVNTGLPSTMLRSRKVLFVQVGSRGDVQPPLAIAAQLHKLIKAQGLQYELHFATHPDFVDWVSE